MGDVDRLPEHMQEAARLWVEKGQPMPRLLRSFFRAVLLHDFISMCAHADHVNRRALFDWGVWLYNDAPSPCHGSDEALMRWHEVGGLEGLEQRMREAHQ